jgi:hypothetical protein
MTVAIFENHSTKLAEAVSKRCISMHLVANYDARQHTLKAAPPRQDWVSAKSRQLEGKVIARDEYSATLTTTIEALVTELGTRERFDKGFAIVIEARAKKLKDEECPDPNGRQGD